MIYVIVFYKDLPQLYLDKISKIDHDKLNVKSIKSKKNKIKEEIIDDNNEDSKEIKVVDKVKISKTPRKKIIK